MARGVQAQLNRSKRLAEAAPYYDLLGIRVIDLSPGFSRLGMLFRNELTYGYGTIHGGAIASIADCAVAMALLPLVRREERIVTIELKMNYISAVRGGQVLAEAKIVHKGSTTAVGEVDVKSQEGKLIAKGLATYMILRGKRVKAS